MPEFVDLSGMVEAGQPVYPGNTRTQFFVTGTHEESALAGERAAGGETPALRRKRRAAGGDAEQPLVRTMIVSEHGPTHVDAFSHLDPTSGESIEEIPLERFYGDAVGLDISDVAPSEFVGPDALRAAAEAGGVSVREGDAVLLHTGHRAATYDPSDPAARQAYLHDHTGLSGDGARWLADAGAANVGIDAPSIDHGSAVETKKYPAHDVCDEHRLLNMENMANLDRVAGERVTLCAFPLRIRDGTGSPIRPVAVVD